MASTNARVSEGLEALRQAQAASDETIEKLGVWIDGASDRDLFRVNPLIWSVEHGVPESVDLFLHATRVGLFRMSWDAMCRGCGALVESMGSLSLLRDHLFCRD